jgi:pimeloyl-ACP methyl ester carboxylesterase
MRKVLRIFSYVLLALLVIALVGPFLVPIPPLEGAVEPASLADPDSRFIEVDGLTLHYKQMGQGEPVMILLHGFGASTYSWREVMEPLSRLGTVIAFDRPAFGLTERPLPGAWSGESPYGPAAQVRLVFGLMDALGVQRAVLIGNSAGGSVSVNAALTQPERVQALVLVDAAIYRGGGSPFWLRPLFQTPQMDRLGPLLARSISSQGMDLLYRSWHDPSRVSPEIVENYRKPLRVQNWDVALWQLTKTSRDLNLETRLGELNLPVLVVTGDDDRVVPTAESLQLARDIPGASLAVFENCGHVPQEECPQAFLEAVEPFIRQVGSSPE